MSRYRAHGTVRTFSICLLGRDQVPQYRASGWEQLCNPQQNSKNYWHNVHLQKRQNYCGSKFLGECAQCIRIIAAAIHVGIMKERNTSLNFSKFF